MSQQTLLVSEETIQQMKQYYQSCLIDPVPYSIFRARKDGTVITAYKSRKVLFQGKNAQEEAIQWGEGKKLTPSKKEPASALPADIATWTLIGSDEVGNGSYFGPLTVCAVFLPQEQQALVKELGAQDSKNLSDPTIQQIAFDLQHTVKYHLTICSPEKYNQAIAKGYNANSIKVSLHNFTLNKLHSKLTPPERKALKGYLVDEFTSPSNYMRYLQKEKNPLTESLYFVRKGESVHLAVACASIIARNAFVQALKKLGEPYGVSLPSGAGKEVDLFGKKLVAQYGKHVLQKTAKLHFANTQKILNPKSFK